MKKKNTILYIFAFVAIMLSLLCVNVSAEEGQEHTVEETTVVPGDMNGDSIVDINDAIYLLRHTMMPSRYPIAQPADVNGTGDVDINDAIYMLRHTMVPTRYPILSDTHTHSLTYYEAKTATCIEDGNIEYWSCSVCNKNYSDENATNEVTDVVIEASHTLTQYSANSASCTSDGNVEYWYCSVCHKSYSDVNATIEVMDTVIEATGHTGGEATCEHKAECTVCGSEYGELADHAPNADDGDCTTAITCSVCGEVTTEANATHTGGEATCEHKAACEVCGKEYGELAEHIGEQIWIKHLDTHYLVYSCCYAQISTTEDHDMVDGICTICGFNPSITVTSVEVTTEDTQVTLTISIADNPGIAGLMLSLQYNTDVFNLTEATNGEALDILTFTAPNDLDSGCTFIWDSIEVNDEDVKDGAFLRLTFDIVPDSLEGEYSILLKVNAYDNELTPFTLLIQGGLITIKNN